MYRRQKSAEEYWYPNRNRDKSQQEDWNPSDYFATRIWKTDDITSVPPMRYTDHLSSRCSPRDSLQIVSIKIASVRGGLRWPIQVFGMVTARDVLDYRKRVIIYARARSNCQTITKKHPYLVLTGPTRAIVTCHDPGNIEIVLKVKGETESDDRDLSFLVLNLQSRGYCYFHGDYTSKRSTLELGFHHIDSAVEATISVRPMGKALLPPGGFQGVFTASTASGNFVEIVLLAFRDGKLPVADDGTINLSRRVVSTGYTREDQKDQLKVSIVARQFPELTMAGFAALRPDKFTGVHFKRWQIKATLWLTHLKVFHVSNGLPEGTISDQDQNKFKEDNTLFVGCVLSILADRLCDVYMHIVDGKELWDALNAKFGATDAGSELYIMESFHDIRMVNNRRPGFFRLDGEWVTSVRGVGTDDNEAPKRSKRRRIEKSFGDDFIVYLVDDTPTSIAEAYASPDADDWKEAVHNEMDSILSNGTWELSERPHGCKPVGCKWVFKKKLRPDGTIEKYKARLVAKGYTQREGEDYFDTYSLSLDLPPFEYYFPWLPPMVLSFIKWT
ncbi:hypothetical protein QYE76_049146 [Lolium multiflorum]|uniref:Reverse transcriptase Ty1/copia-type domain-containing protein n=1 Tax=Lolium multiflorum TaxID=4521 RepID=A0AAD8SMF4_LOLMU|nr:hypothetical protein QYE76_049146 [Lolium multiflorum]